MLANAETITTERFNAQTRSIVEIRSPEMGASTRKPLEGQKQSIGGWECLRRGDHVTFTQQTCTQPVYASRSNFSTASRSLDLRVCACPPSPPQSARQREKKNLKKYLTCELLL